MTQAISDKALQVEVAQRQPMPLEGAFDCAAGAVLAIVGPSGAGKTSMLRVLAGLMRPQQARVVVGGEVWCDTAQGLFLAPRSRHVGLVFQDYALMPHLDAVDNVALSLLQLPRAARRARARDWLARLQLTPQEQTRRPPGLSGGQQQRVAVARALAREPRLLLLDEPFSAVDQMNRQGLYQILADLKRTLAITIVLVTHDLNESRLLADSMVVMDAGRVLQQGPPASIHGAPRNARVADIVGIQNRFRGRWLGPSGRAGRGLLRWSGHTGNEHDAPTLEVRDKGRIEPGQSVNWVITGDGINLLERAPLGADEFRAVVDAARHLGEITLATLTLPEVPGALLHVTLSGPRRVQLSIGAALTARLDLEQVHVMPVRG